MTPTFNQPMVLALVLLTAALCWCPMSARAQNGDFFIDKTLLDKTDRQYTSNGHRSFVVAGCVPKHVPGKVHFAGSKWAQCNDLDFVKDKVVESEFVTCLDLYENGVLQGFFIKEINNRDWQSFRFSCRDLQKDGTVGSKFEKAKFLFNFEKEGKLYESTVPTNHVAFGVFELWNKLELRESLLTVALNHQNATAIFDAAKKNQRPADIRISEKVPPSSPVSISTTSWFCPLGMVMTGAAIGHIPNHKENKTRAVYILAECRKLFRR